MKNDRTQWYCPLCCTVLTVASATIKSTTLIEELACHTCKIFWERTSESNTYRLQALGSEVERRYSEMVRAEIESEHDERWGRLRELLVRLVASGPKAAHVSASECHEICESGHEAIEEIEKLQGEIKRKDQALEMCFEWLTADYIRPLGGRYAIEELQKHDDRVEEIRRVAIGDLPKEGSTDERL